MREAYDLDAIEDFHKAEEHTAETICTYLVQHHGYEWTSDGGIRHQLQPHTGTILSDTDMDRILQDANPKEALNDYIDVELALPAKERFINRIFPSDYQKAFAQLPVDMQGLLVRQAKSEKGEDLPLHKLASRFIDYVNLELSTNDIRNRLLFQPTKLSVNLANNLVRPSHCKPFLMELAMQQELDGVVEKAFRQYEWRGSRQHLPQETLPYIDAYSKLIRMRHPEISIQTQTEFHYALAFASQMETPPSKDKVEIFSIHGDLLASDKTAGISCHLPLPKGCILPMEQVVSLSAQPLPDARHIQNPAIAFMEMNRREWKRSMQGTQTRSAASR